MRLLYYVDSLGLGGANQTTLTVASAMRQAGHDVWFASEDGPLMQKLVDAGLIHVPVRTHARHPSPRAIRVLIQTIRQHRIQLLCPNGFDCTLDAVPAALWTNCPILPTYGGLTVLPYPHPWLPRVNLFSQELEVKLQNRFAWEQETFHHLIARIDESRFHSGVRGEDFRREFAISLQAPLLVTVCRLDAAKVAGIHVLLDEAVEIWRKVPGVRILILGDGDSHGMVKERAGAVNHQVGAEFVLAPGSSQRTAEAFAAATVVIANGARSALEAMACGKPIISVGPNGFCGVFSSETIEGFRRFNFDKGRLEGNPLGRKGMLATVAAHLLRDAELREDLGRFSLDYARDHLCMGRAAAQYQWLYEETLKEPWRGKVGRMKVAWRYLRTVAQFYVHRLRLRIRRRAVSSFSAKDLLAPPPEGLDPDWRPGVEIGETD